MATAKSESSPQPKWGGSERAGVCVPSPRPFVLFMEVSPAIARLLQADADRLGLSVDDYVGELLLDYVSDAVGALVVEGKVSSNSTTAAIAYTARSTSESRTDSLTRLPFSTND